MFSRQVLALAAPEDLLVAISTSGASENVLRGVRAGHKVGCKAVALTGGRACELDELVECSIKVPSEDTPRIQEGHAIVLHIIAQLAEEALSAGR